MDERLRVLFVIPSLTGGGAERVVTTLARGLDRRRFKPMLAVVSMEGAVFRKLIPEDVEVFDLGARRVRYALWPLTQLVWRERPHLVMSTLDHLNVAMALARAIWPTQVKLAMRLTHFITLESALGRALARAALPAADLLIYQSEEMRDGFERTVGVNRSRSVAIYNPIRIQEVRAASVEPVDTGFSNEHPNLVAVGRLSREKGFDLAIEALRLSSRRDVTLTILGEGPLEQELRTQAQRAGVSDRVRFLGFQPNPFPFIAQASALLLSSRFEGLPNVMLEALACGTPLIATPLPGVTGVLAPIPGCELSDVTDAPSIAAAMDRFFAQAPAQVPVDAVDRFDSALITRQYEDAFVGACRSSVKRRTFAGKERSAFCG